MRIGIVATELSPFIESTPRSADIASLASAFTSLGHDVFAIIPVGQQTKLADVHTVLRLCGTRTEDKRSNKNKNSHRFHKHLPKAFTVIIFQ